MTLTWLAKRHLAIFFLGVLTAYLGALYIAAFPHHDDLSRALIRLTAPIAELGLAWLACNAVRGMAFQKRWGALLCYTAIPLLITVVYTAQIYSLYLSGNLVSVLAMQNTAESRIIRGGSMYLALCLGLSWWVLFLAGFLYAGHISRPRLHTKRLTSNIMRRGAIVATLLAYAAVLFHVQKDNGLLEPDYRQSPLITLLRNYYDLKHAAIADAPGNSKDSAALLHNEAKFPLEKSWIYKNPLPFPNKANPGTRPNVIVIFTEGTSARLLGCYGGQYPDLTPNIDKLARVSMRVVNYYNHTAATYRGIQGQMVSGYPAAGGGEDSAPWETESGRKTLSAIHYRSIPDILHENSYNTYFISPHYNSVGLNTLLRSLGFDKVFSFEDISHDIAPGNKLYFVEGALSDGDIFNALRILMSNETLNHDGHPFLIGLYNFGTHAFIDVMPNGRRYGDGSNSALNKLHNYDYEVGQFLNYFFASQYAKNTILVLTADHATYPDQPFRAVAGPDYKPLFVDRIPLIIYDPTHALPSIYDADGRTSLDLAPTLLQLLGVQHDDNSFLGTSLFEKKSTTIGFSAIGNEFFATDAMGAYPENALPEQYLAEFLQDQKRVKIYYRLEQENRISPSAIGSNP